MKFSHRLLILFLTGFIFGPIGDYSHVLSGTTTYPQEKFGYYLLTLPFWVPFLFGVGTALIGLGVPILDKVLGSSKERLGTRNMPIALLGLFLLLGIYFLSGYLPFRAGGFGDLILAGLVILLWLALDSTWQGVVLGILVAAVGTLTEINLVKLGAFSYLPRAANFFGVPTWLPWLYFGGSVAVGNWGRVLSRSREQKV